MNIALLFQRFFMQAGISGKAIRHSSKCRYWFQKIMLNLAKPKPMHFTLTDEEVLLFANGNDEIYSRICDRFFTPAELFAFSLIDNIEYAADIASDTMQELHDDRKQFSSMSMIRNWVYQQVKLSSLEYLTRSGIDKAYENLLLKIESNPEFVEKLLEQSHELESIYLTIDKLDKPARLLLTYKYAKGWTNAQMMEKWRLSDVELTKLIPEALDQLRQVTDDKTIALLLLSVHPSHKC